MKKITFVTHNKGKIASAKKILEGVDLEVFEYDLDEPRSDDISYISKCKVIEGYNLVKKPCISLDCGFWIDELNGFPKAFVNFALETIGINGILSLMENKTNRTCRFTECLSYYDGENLKQFMGFHKGNISTKIDGINSEKKWSDLWYIFIPSGSNKTLAAMSEEERANRPKIESESVDALSEFAIWYKSHNTEQILHRKL